MVLFPKVADIQAALNEKFERLIASSTRSSTNSAGSDQRNEPGALYGRDVLAAILWLVGVRFDVIRRG